MEPWLNHRCLGSAVSQACIERLHQGRSVSGETRYGFMKSRTEQVPAGGEGEDEGGTGTETEANGGTAVGRGRTAAQQGVGEGQEAEGGDGQTGGRDRRRAGGDCRGVRAGFCPA